MVFDARRALQRPASPGNLWAADHPCGTFPEGFSPQPGVSGQGPAKKQGPAKTQVGTAHPVQPASVTAIRLAWRFIARR
jgi:hypothetical protein